MKKILVPCDFSRTAEEAFRFAVDIAKKTESEIHLLNVVDNSLARAGSPELSYNAGFNGIFIQKLEQQLNGKFCELRTKYAGEDIPVSFVMEVGSLAQNIEHYIADKEIELVVMGTNGASGLKELLVGSNTEKIVRNSRVPVVAVPLGSYIDSVKDIVFPIDPADDPTNFIKELRFIRNLYRAKLHILWINTQNIFKADGEAMEDLRDFAEEHHLHDYKLHLRSDYSEHEGILRFASEINASLIFMPTHGRKGVRHWLAGSITESVVNHVQCPVWTCSI